MIMIKLDDLRPIFISIAMSFKILGSTASRPIFLQLIARPINLGWIYPILYQTWVKDAIGVPSYVNEVKGHIPRSRVIWGGKYWFSLLRSPVSFERLKSDWDQTMLMWSKVLYQGQGSFEVKLEEMLKMKNSYWVSFEKLKSDWNQTWFMDIKWETLYVDEVKVTYWGQRSSEVKLEERLKMKITLIWKVDVWLEPNMVYGYQMETFICWWGHA